jgi:hypothetical protein
VQYPIEGRETLSLSIKEPKFGEVTLKEHPQKVSSRQWSLKFTVRLRDEASAQALRKALSEHDAIVRVGQYGDRSTTSMTITAYVEVELVRRAGKQYTQVMKVAEEVVRLVRQNIGSTTSTPSPREQYKSSRTRSRRGHTNTAERQPVLTDTRPTRTGRRG